MAIERTLGELVKRAAAGDDAAVADLYTETSSHAYYLALQLVKDEDAAQDILQDAYVKALMNLNTLEDPSKFQSWLNSIVVNTGKSYLKKRQPVLFSQMESNDDDNEPVDFADESEQFSPEATVDYNETKRLVKEMIDRLPEQQRIAIVLYYMEDYSIKQIAEFMGCSEGTVKSRLNYGRKQIEKDVLDLEKKGTKLYCAPLVPFLIWMFHTPASTAAISAAEAATLGAGVAAGTTAGTMVASGSVGAAAATGTTVGAVTPGSTTGTTAASGSVGAATSTGTTVGAATAGSTTGAAAASGSVGAAMTPGAAVGSTAAVQTVGAAVGTGAATGATLAAGSTLDAAALSQMTASAIQAAASTNTTMGDVTVGQSVMPTIATGSGVGASVTAAGLSAGAKAAITAAVAVCIIGGGAAGVYGYHQYEKNAVLNDLVQAIENKNYKEAVALSDKALELQSENTDVYFMLDEAYEATDSLEEAIDILAQGYLFTGDEDLHSLEIDRRNEHGKELFMEGRLNESEDAFLTVLDMDPENETGYESLIDIYMEENDWEKLSDLIDQQDDVNYTEETRERSETISSSLKIIQELIKCFEAEDYDGVFELMQGEEFLILQRFSEGADSHLLFLDGNRGLGIYPVTTEGYGDYMIYYGDYADGKRQGYGAWVGYLDGNNYRAMGNWNNDAPNGEQKVYEWSGNLNENVNMRIITGPVENGLWNGAVNWCFYEKDGSFEIFPVTFEEGKWLILREEDNAVSFDGYYVVGGTSEKETMNAKTPDVIEGIEGFRF